MMRKIKYIRLLLLGVLLVVSLCVLSGCRQEAEVVFFSEESFSQQAADGAVPEDKVAVDVSPEMDLGANAAADAEAYEELTAGKIMVYICGAVKEPGVVELPEGSRVNDAVQAAGGFAEDASVTSVNLAAKLEDEEMICVLTEEEAKVLGAASETGLSAADNDLVNINTADIYRLCSLPGIGESKARDIVTYREEHGAFQKKEDIMKVTGIKENLYRKICDLISVK